MVIVIIIFLILTSIILYGNLRKKFRTTSDANEKISVIIAAKNEGENIPKLIPALAKQNYPEENYEVIIVDDESTDKTFDITENLISDLPNFKILKVQNKKYKGKRGALQFGIENSQHPNILITDADCQPERNWINEFANKFNAGYQFVFGAAPFRQKENLINKISCFENLRTHILTFGLANAGFPYSAAARSLGFKKKSFNKIAGYNNTTDTLSGDDDLLLREAVKNKLQVATIVAPEAFVFSETKNTFADYLKQKARHTSTANYYTFTVKLFLGLWHTLNILFLLSPLLMFINIKFGIFFLIKFIADFFIVKFLMKKFCYHFSFWEIIYLQIIYEIMLIINYFNGTFGKREW